VFIVGLVSVVAIAASPSAFANSAICADLFVPKASARIEASPILERTLLSFETRLGEGSTTSLRREDKYVVSRKLIDQVLVEFTKHFGDSFVLRDKKQDGRKNMTVTQYAVPIVFSVNGIRKSAKFRIRKYYSDSIHGGDLRPAAVTDGRAFLELKIDHPIHDGVVVKPRLLISDEDAAIVQDRTAFVLKKHHLAARWKIENPKVPGAVIDGFVSALASTYAAVGPSMPLFAKTSYVRDSYSLYVPDTADPAAKPVEIQFTIDREISVQDSRTGRMVAAYGPNDVVVEVKVPLAFASLTQTQRFTALRQVAQVKTLLAAEHNRAFVRGAGKLSTFTRTVDFGD
jgi:hypothetical protein